MATTFHRFLHLPWEIQDQIWKLSVEPRTVKVRRVRVPTSKSAPGHSSSDNSKGPRPPLYELVTTTPAPVAGIATYSQANYKSQTYQRVFAELDTVRSGEERRHIWLNLDIDTVDVGFSKGFHLWDYGPVAHSIRRLKFETTVIGQADKYALKKAFVNLQELHITCSKKEPLPPRQMMWQFASWLPHSMEKVVVHNTDGGLTCQLDARPESLSRMGYAPQDDHVPCDERGDRCFKVTIIEVAEDKKITVGWFTV